MFFDYGIFYYKKVSIINLRSKIIISNSDVKVVPFNIKINDLHGILHEETSNLGKIIEKPSKILKMEGDAKNNLKIFLGLTNSYIPSISNPTELQKSILEILTENNSKYESITDKKIYGHLKFSKKKNKNIFDSQNDKICLYLYSKGEKVELSEQNKFINNFHNEFCTKKAIENSTLELEEEYTEMLNNIYRVIESPEIEIFSNNENINFLDFLLEKYTKLRNIENIVSLYKENLKLCSINNNHYPEVSVYNHFVVYLNDRTDINLCKIKDFWFEPTTCNEKGILRFIEDSLFKLNKKDFF
ncbi:hypothetical protein CWI38_0001p0100 [Hamiltosporidium tvaerminnensis]|uniref:Uncharacterized protein n=1 Tax=Hamiltosporidium tvaerminnensis TaxID=1176355 RepID=A0A4Q9M2T7_9MICR|nr:hypothetical protein CWI38_0001p0100 [Hamiltosporidium tvaerminnensis]